MKELKKVDYQSAVIGKWHLKTNPVAFDHWEILPGQGLGWSNATKTNHSF